MKKWFTLLLFVPLWFQAQAQCPGCPILLPVDLPTDTIFLDLAPDGQVGVFYQEDISFRLPQTTTPVAAVDPTVIPGLPISQIDILSVANLPPGVTWEASQLSFETAEETDGCVRFCGTPLFADSFFVEVQVEANVFGFTQTSGFFLVINVLPAVSSTDGFTLINNVGCGSTTVSVENNVPSNGQAGFTYSWDFGNGTVSNEENPGPVTYDEPGIYVVQYTATIDTTGYFLTAVTVEETDCNDIAIPPANKPDLFIRLEDIDGNGLYTSPTVTNADLPLTFNVFLPMEPGIFYNVEVKDDELIGIEDCGSFDFSINTPTTLTDGSLTVTLTILHPVTEILATDTVYVYEIPEQPEVSYMPLEPLCPGEEVLLSTAEGGNYQWFQGGIPISGATDAQVIITEEGWYSVVYATDEGCEAVSDSLFVPFLSMPDEPVFSILNNLLTLDDVSGLPVNYALQWYLDGMPVPGATDWSYCLDAPGDFVATLEVTDLDSGCSNAFSMAVTFDPTQDCTTGVASLAFAAGDFTLFPNPTDQYVTLLSGSELPGGQADIRFITLQGQTLAQRTFSHGAGQLEQTLDLQALPSGIYLCQLRLDDRIWIGRVVKR